MDLELFDTAGTPTYSLACHTGFYEGDRSFNYSGEFECRLASLYSGELYSNLLTSDRRQTADWLSRARFFTYDLIGECRDLPHLGNVRSFRLRHMKITLAFFDEEITFEEEGDDRYAVLESFSFRVQVVRDTSAHSPIAYEIGYRHLPEKYPGSSSECLP